MDQFLLLNFLLVIFFIATILENRIKLNVPKIKETSIKISPRFLLVYLVVGIFLTLLFILKGPRNIIQGYIFITFSALIVGNFLWISINKDLMYKKLAFIGALAVISFRLFYPSILSHDIFIASAMLWIGPFFTQLELMTKKRFIIISVLLFFYDIGFVWLTSTAVDLNKTTQAAGLPLALTVGESWIGTGDLLYANVLLSLVKGWKWKLVTVCLLIGSNILLGIAGNKFEIFDLFPLLVVWGPIGIITVLISHLSPAQSDP